ncbi:cytochrome P450 [Actinoalloteichus hoggarensis]|uniref:Cytochrome P450 107B1 n=1 Tax=Actinoalloteichus hoggarensis TaxID=1470176 RepID=A0A221W5S6_9PSEU|nr:cytochrome P450 [Actinoalloteichus hoggarensis]ASO21260.1 Cytochrome P450 107B1 [Actinoalloteichus hoggarensis]MBB5921192.1 cytochrome P450 [Actinoalloteichus hoggarensis]
MTPTDPLGQDHVHPPDGARSSPPPGCPAHDGVTRLYLPEFAADPNAVYDSLRAQGPVAPVEIAPGVPATLVTSYSTALEVLRDPRNFPKDPRRWQQTVPPDSPVLPMLMYRDNCLFTDGERHRRLRAALNDGLGGVDSVTLRGYVERGATTLIDEFAPAGEADLLTQYGRLLPILVLDQMFATPPHLSERLTTALGTIFEGVAANAEQANRELFLCTAELVETRRAAPGRDVVSWLIAHPAELTQEELVSTIMLLMAAGIEPTQNLIANVLRLLLSDDRFAGGLTGGSVALDDALTEILWTDPPMANYATTHPIHDVYLAGGVRVPGDRPVLISLAAANADPEVSAARASGNRAHLAWSAGPHVCPAQSQAMTIASVAVETLLDRLPDLELAVPVDDLTWRPGPFHRALDSLPVRFPPVRSSVRPDENTGDSRWNVSPPPPMSSTPQAPTSRARRGGSGSGESPRWLSSLVRWWRGL